MKSYVSPIVSFESFELSANTANACGNKTHTPTNHTCGVDVPGVGMVFLNEVEGCKYKGSDGDHSVCYDIPLDSTRLFNS